MKKFSLFLLVAMGALTPFNLVAADEPGRVIFQSIEFAAPTGYTSNITNHDALEKEVLTFGQGTTEAEAQVLVESGDLDEEDVELLVTTSNAFPVRTLQVSIINLPEDAFPVSLSEQEKAVSTHERFSRGFMNRWGGTSFCVFHQDLQITSCLNTVGAFIAVHTKLVEGSLVSVEAIDWVEFRQNEDLMNADKFETLPEVEKWAILKPIANGEEALSLLMSVQIQN